MNNEILNSDTLKAVQDTVSAAKEEIHTLNNLTFDISKIGSDGIIITILGYVVVFVALVILFLIVNNIKNILNFNIKSKLKREGKITEGTEIKPEEVMTGEVNAAIATALYLFFEEAHDMENTVLTIKKVQRPYSPWSSKIYGLRQFPKR